MTKRPGKDGGLSAADTGGALGFALLCAGLVLAFGWPVALIVAGVLLLVAAVAGVL